MKTLVEFIKESATRFPKSFITWSPKTKKNKDNYIHGKLSELDADIGEKNDFKDFYFVVFDNKMKFIGATDVLSHIGDYDGTLDTAMDVETNNSVNFTFIDEYTMAVTPDSTKYDKNNKSIIYVKILFFTIKGSKWPSDKEWEAEIEKGNFAKFV